MWSVKSLRTQQEEGGGGGGPPCAPPPLLLLVFLTNNKNIGIAGTAQVTTRFCGGAPTERQLGVIM